VKSILRILPFQNFSEALLKVAVWKGKHIVRFYYIALFFLAVTRIGDWSYYLAKNAIDPLWPIAWLNLVDYSFGVNIIFTLLLIGTFLAALFPKMRFTRFMAFFALFAFVAFINSFGKIGHSSYLWVLTSFLLIFLPNERKGEKSYFRNFLTIFWGCQAIVLLTYTMSGAWKIYYAFVQMGMGQVHAFYPGAMSYQVADRLLKTNATSLLGPFIIDQVWLGWPLYVGAIFIELFAFYAVFRLKLHRLWAVLLVSMHIGIYLTMTIDFTKSVLLLAILFFNSPFISAENRWQNTFYDLPIIGFFLRKKDLS
jgi:hypothetical protein